MFILAHGLRAQFVVVGQSWLQELEATCHDASHSQEGERDGCWGSAHFLLFIPSATPAQGMEPPTFRVALPFSINTDLSPR